MHLAYGEIHPASAALRITAVSLEGRAMGITAILQIADQLLNGFQQQVANPDKIGTAKQSPETQTAGPVGEDTFTSSQQTGTANTASEAGIFQVEQFNFTAVNTRTPTPAAAPTNPNVAANNAPAIPTANIAPPAAVTNAVQPAATSTAAVPVNAAPIVAPESTQNSLQTLNSALAALGLNAAEIQAFDQFASVILQFDPNGLQILQTQLNALATRFGSAAPAGANATSSTNSANSANNSAAAPNFQLNGLSVSFGVASGSPSGASNASATTNGNQQSSAFQLQISEIQITLTAPNGQTVQLGSSQPAAGTQNIAQPAAAIGQAARA
jgi:hypothetical protein